MKLLLLRQAKITHKAGEIVEVSPAEANFLLSVHSAEIVHEFGEYVDAETPEKVVPKTTRKKK